VAARGAGFPPLSSIGDRRSFLRGALALGGATALGSAAGCGDGSGSGGTGGGARSYAESSSSTGAGGPPDWSHLAAVLSGSLVLPTSAAYVTDKLLYDERFDTIEPAAIAYVAGTPDVQRCVAFARDHDLPLAARSGGHSYGGYSSCPGLVVDVTSLNRVTPTPGAVGAGGGSGQVTVGAGTRLVDLYAATAAAGLPSCTATCWPPSSTASPTAPARRPRPSRPARAG